MLAQAVSDAAFEVINANHALDGQEKNWLEEVQNQRIEPKKRVIFDPNTGVVEEAMSKTYVEDIYVNPLD